MPRVLVIGYGNPLRGDDGLGWAAARQVAISCGGRPVEVLTVHQLTPDLAEPVSRAGLVIFIDAADGGEPGAAVWRPVPVPDNAAVTPSFTHQVTPPVLALLAKELYGTCPPMLVCTVGGASFATGEALSPLVSRSVTAVVAGVLEAADAHA